MKTVTFNAKVVAINGIKVTLNVFAYDENGTQIGSYLDVSSDANTNPDLIATKKAKDRGDYGKPVVINGGDCGCFLIDSRVNKNRQALLNDGIDLGSAVITFRDVYTFDPLSSDPKVYTGVRVQIGDALVSKTYKNKFNGSAQPQPQQQPQAQPTPQPTPQPQPQPTFKSTTSSARASAYMMGETSKKFIPLLEKSLGLMFGLETTEELNRIINTVWNKIYGTETFSVFDRLTDLKGLLKALCTYIRVYCNDAKETVDKYLKRIDFICNTEEWNHLVDIMKKFKPATVINQKGYCITGATGSGKSTIINDILENHLGINLDTGKLESFDVFDPTTHRHLVEGEYLNYNFNPEIDSTTLEAAYNASNASFNPSAIIRGLIDGTLKVLILDEFLRAQESTMNFSASMMDNKGYFNSTLVKDESGHAIRVPIPDDFKVIMIGNVFEVDGTPCGKIPMFVISRMASAIHVDRLKEVEDILSKVDDSTEVTEADCEQANQILDSMSVENMLQGYVEEETI